MTEESIRSLYSDNLLSEDGRAFVVADPNELLDRTGQTILSRLSGVRKQCKKVKSAISSNVV